MSISRASFFLFVFLFHSFGYSRPVEETVESIFTDFAVDLLLEGHITNVEEELNRLTAADWSNGITNATENWTASEARAFLDVLMSSGIAHRSILNILQAIDYIKAIKSGHHFTFSGQLQPAIQRENASKVFFEFVKNDLGISKIEDRMGTEWREDISHHTRYWPIEDAEYFLATLLDLGFSLNSILRLLQAPDYLEKLRAGQINFEFFQRPSAISVEAVSLETSQQTNSQDIIETQSAAAIFIAGAKQYFRTEFEQQRDKKYKSMSYEEAFQKEMGSDWEDQIRRYTEHWTAQDAYNLLDHLVNRIGETVALERIKGASYLKKMRNYNRFLERVNFYEIHIGEDEVTYRLSRSLGGFEGGDIEEIKRVIEFLEGYLGSREIIKDMMLDSLGGFSILSGKVNAQTNLKNIEDVIAYLRSIEFTEEQIQSMIFENFYGFGKATRKKLESKRQSLTKGETIGMVFTLGEIDKMIEENIQGFLQANLVRVKKVVAYLKEIRVEDDKIKEMAIRNLLGLAKGDPKTLDSKRQSLRKEETIGIAFSLDETDKMIEESIEDFLRADLRKVKKMVAYLKEIRVEDDKIKEMAIGNLLGLAKGDPKTLDSKRQSLRKEETIGMAFSLSEIDKMIEESIQGFLQADLVRVKKVVAYLKEIRVEDDKIKEMVIRNLQGLAKGDPKTLESKRQFLRKEETIGMTFTLGEIDKMIEESIENFLRADIAKVKKMVAYLKEIKVEDDKIKEMAIRNLKGLAKGDPKTLESKRQSLTQTMTIGMAFTLGEIDKMIEESIEGFLQADLRKVKMMVAYLKEIRVEDDKIKEMVIRNLQGLAKGDPKTLESKRQSLTKEETIGMAFSLGEIDKMIEENIEGFLRADLIKVKMMVAYLKEIGIENDDIKDMTIRNLSAFSTIKKYELRDMIEALKNEPQLSNVKEETLMTKIREMIRTQNLMRFYYNFDNNLKTLICTRALSK